MYLSQYPVPPCWVLAWKLSVGLVNDWKVVNVKGAAVTKSGFGTLSVPKGLSVPNGEYVWNVSVTTEEIVCKEKSGFEETPVFPLQNWAFGNRWQISVNAATTNYI